MTEWLSAWDTLAAFGGDVDEHGLLIANHAYSKALDCLADEAWIGDDPYKDVNPPHELWAGAPTWTAQNWRLGMFTADWSPVELPPGLTIQVRASDVKFSRADVVALVGTKGIKRIGARRGRPSGAGSYADQDEALLDEMRGLIAEGKAKSGNEAAGLVAHKAKAISIDAARDRLGRAYSRKFGNKSARN